MGPAHADGAGDAHFAFALLREDNEDVHDQQDARNRRERSQEPEDLDDEIDVRLPFLDGPLLHGDDGLSGWKPRSELRYGLVRESRGIGRSARIRDEYCVDLPRRVQESLGVPKAVSTFRASPTRASSRSASFAFRAASPESMSAAAYRRPPTEKTSKSRVGSKATKSAAGST